MVLEGRDREWLEGWLEERQQEAAEYYAAIYDARGRLVERSDTRLVEVLDPDRCVTDLTPRERGRAENLTIGETTELQEGQPIFHWHCDGVVTRVSAAGILRADDYAGESSPAGVPGPKPVSSATVASAF